MKLETELDSIEWLWSAKALAVVSAWNALGWFERLKKGPLYRSELGGDARAIAITLPVLVHLGLIATDGERLVLTPRAQKLVEQRELPTDRNLEFLADLSRMVDVLRDGGPVKDASGKSKETQGGTRADDLEHTERFLDQLYRRSRAAAEATRFWLEPLLPNPGAIIDVGGGHGGYAEAFVNAGHQVTLFDQPHVIEIAKKRHADRMHYIAGNFHTAEDFGGPYDLALLSNVVHGESDADNAKLLTRLAKSVRPGGAIVIKDMFIDEHGQDPVNAVFFGLTMLFYTKSGTSPTLRQARAWFDAAGLGDFQVMVLDTHQLVIGRRPHA